MKQQKQETLMRRPSFKFELTNDAIRELRRLWSEGHWRRVEPLRRNCDATRNQIHAGDAPSHQAHRATGTTDRTPSFIAGVHGMSAVPQCVKNGDMCRGAQAPHRRLSPRFDARSKPVSVPLPHPRFAVQARVRACHDRRSAFGSHRIRVAALPHQPRRSGAGGPDTGFH